MERTKRRATWYDMAWTQTQKVPTDNTHCLAIVRLVRTRKCVSGTDEATTTNNVPPGTCEPDTYDVCVSHPLLV